MKSRLYDLHTFFLIPPYKFDILLEFDHNNNINSEGEKTGETVDEKFIPEPTEVDEQAVFQNLIKKRNHKNSQVESQNQNNQVTVENEVDLE